MKTQLQTLGIFLLCVGFLATGCKTLHVPSPLGWMKPKVKESKVESPENIVCMWSNDVLAAPGKPPARGIGGRLYFYDSRQKIVPVEGQLIVYGYDDSKPDVGGDRVPDRKFAFTPEQFQQHFSQSQLGPSYSVWLPWEEAGGPSKQLTLLPVFTSSAGKLVMGQPSVCLLPGPLGEGQAANSIRTKRFSSDTPQTVQAVGHNESIVEKPIREGWEANRPKDGSMMQTTTIDLPQPTSQRMMRSISSPPTPGSNGKALSATPTPSQIESDRAATTALLQQWNQYQTNLKAREIPTSQAAAPATPQPEGRFARPKLPAPIGRSEQSVPAHDPSLPYRSGSQFGPAFQP